MYHNNIISKEEGTQKANIKEKSEALPGTLTCINTNSLHKFTYSSHHLKKDHPIFKGWVIIKYSF